MRTDPAPEWVLLLYRLPRDPSTPRTAVWRRLRRLGVAQLSDGLVALPADPRSREALEWVAQQVREADGTAATWLARPTSRSQADELVEQLRAARAGEYAAVAASAREAASLDDAERRRVLRRLRGELRAIRRRDWFAGDEQDDATRTVEALAPASAQEVAR